MPLPRKTTMGKRSMGQGKRRTAAHKPEAKQARSVAAPLRQTAGKGVTTAKSKKGERGAKSW